jgi:hypothetical protein
LDGRFSEVSGPVAALVDAETWALLALSDYPYVCSVLAKSPLHRAEDVYGVNWPNYRDNFAIAKEKVYPVWRWNPQTRVFEPTPELMVTPELKQRSVLAVKKTRALWEVVYELSAGRYTGWRGLVLQETVYFGKRLQAQKFKDDGYPDDDVARYPYVLQWAEFAEVTPRVAADEILFKAQLDDDLLSKTEYLRLKYFKLLNEAVTVEELEPILTEFRWETYKRWEP